MGIRKILITRDKSVANVNPKYIREDGTVIPQWEIRSEKGSYAEVTDYYLTPESQWVHYDYQREGKIAPGYILGKDETKFIGKVLKIKVECERVMSDVWEDIRRALVFSPETVGQRTNGEHSPIQETEYCWIHVSGGGYSECVGEVVVDAPQEVIENWERMETEKKEREEKAYWERKAQDSRERLENGKVVEVVKGRKVKKGTKGLIFWIGNNGYGESVGIATTPKKGKKTGRNGKEYDSYLDVVFVASGNVEVVGSTSQEAMEQTKRDWESTPF